MSDQAPSPESICALAESMLALHRHQPLALVISAYLASLLALSHDTPRSRPTLIWELRALAALIEAVGETQGEEAAAIVNENLGLFERVVGPFH